MIKLSTGLRNALISNYGLGIMMNGGVIKLYDGTMPSTPDNPPDANELGFITTGGKLFYPPNDPNEAGLYLEALSPGGLINSGEWRLRGTASGTVTWWRWYWSGEETEAFSTFYPRVDGDVITDLDLTDNEITEETNRLISHFLFVLPVGG